ncbi:MAG: eCIS core domain-containing protein [Coleofasciculus sp.]
MVYDHQSKSSSWTPTPRKSSFFPPSHIQTKTEANKGSELVGNLPSKAQRDKIRRSLFGDIPQMTGAKAETASQEAKAVENPTQVSEEADSGEIQAKAETGLSQSQGYGVPSREVRNKIRRSLFGNLEQTPVQKQEEGTSPPTSILQGEGSMDDARGEAKGLAETEITLPIQAKLTIGEPNDKYEQEADRVARQVVDKIHSPTPETVQREEMGDEDEVRLKSEAGSGEKVEAGVGVTGVRMSPIEGVTINRKVNSEGETQEASVELEASIQGKRGSGQPLDESVKEPMEGAFGADFSGVRVHTDTQSDELNQAIQAKAFTTGEDIFFREGAYEPGSKGGQELLAHELTHVVQQSGGVVQRQVLKQVGTKQPQQKQSKVAKERVKFDKKLDQNAIQRGMYTMLSQYQNNQENKQILIKGKKRLEQNNEDFRDIGDNLKKLNRGEILYIYAHGNEDKFGKMKPQELIEHLIEKGLQPEKRSIILKGCKSEKFAKQMSNDFKKKPGYEEVTVIGMPGVASQTKEGGKMTVLKDEKKKALRDIMKARHSKGLPTGNADPYTTVHVVTTEDGNTAIEQDTEKSKRLEKRRKIKDEMEQKTNKELEEKVEQELESRSEFPQKKSVKRQKKRNNKMRIEEDSDDSTD